MPIAKVRLEDGRIARFNVPEGTTAEQVTEYVQANKAQFAEPAGPPAKQDTPDATAARASAPAGMAKQPGFLSRAGSAISEAFTGSARATPQTERLPELQQSGLLADEDGARVAAISPALLSATDPDEIAQIVQSNFPNVGVSYNKDAQGNVYPILVNNKTGAATIINRPGLSTMDVLQGIGIGAAFTPAGRAGTVAGVAGRSAATEAGLQAGQKAAGGEFDGEEVALAGAIGGGGKAAENLISAGTQLVRGAPAEDAAGLLRSAEAVDIPVTTSDALPPETFAARMARDTGEKIPLAGTGPLRQRQQAARESAVDEFTSRYGDYSYGAIVDSLKQQSGAVKRRAGNVLQSVGQKLDPIGEVPVSRTQQAISEVTEALDKPGTIRNPQALEALEQLIMPLRERAPNFTTLKELRTEFRDIVKGIDSAERSQLTSRGKALLERVGNALSADMREFAKENLTPAELAKWERANSVYGQEARKLTRSRLKNVLDKGDITPEAVKPVLFSRNQSELGSLYQSLTPTGRQNARAAIVDKIVTDLGRRQGGVTPNSFATEARKYRPQINTFFKGRERAELDGLLQVLDATRRAQDAAVTTPTGQQLLGAGAAGAAVIDLGTTLGTLSSLGATARLYESPQVRNALLKLAAAPKGSRRWDEALTNAQTALTAGLQTARSAQEE